MPYNVGPDFKRTAPSLYTCDDCEEIVAPQWSGHDGAWQCPVCYADLPDYEEPQT